MNKTIISLRTRKEGGTKLQDALFTNLKLLNHIYPPSPEYNRVFKRDMFTKGNKVAFFQIIYYLFETLDPKLTKEKITCWPPYDISRENKFRTEVLKFVNDINAIYEHANIPVLMASHLIAPNGAKIVQFLFKISRLVIYEHLVTSDLEHSKILLPVIPTNKHVSLTKSITTNVKMKTAQIEKETVEAIEHFEDVFNKVNKEAEEIIVKQRGINEDLKEVGRIYETQKEIFVGKYDNLPSSEDVLQKVNDLYEKLNHIKSTASLFQNCTQLIDNIQNGATLFKYNKDTVKVPDRISAIDEQLGTLDLIALLEELKLSLNCQNLELPNFTHEELNKFNTDLIGLQRYLMESDEEITDLYANLEETLRKQNKVIKILQDLSP